jgi:hypothetical protein
MHICQVAKPTIINQIHTKLLADYFTVPRTMPSGDDAVAATMPVYDAVRRRCRCSNDAVHRTMPVYDAVRRRCRPSDDERRTRQQTTEAIELVQLTRECWRLFSSQNKQD